MKRFHAESLIKPIKKKLRVPGELFSKTKVPS